MDEKKEKTKYKRATFTYDGKRYERKGKTLAEAHAKAAVLKEQLKRGEVGLSGNMTVKAWADEWLEVYKAKSVGNSHYLSLKGYIKNAIDPEIGVRRIKDIKDVELQKILNARSGHSKSDLTKLRNVIREIFKRAHVSGLISKNPAEYLELPKSENGTRRSITDKERKKILEVAETHYAGLWVKLILYCGLRPNETRALDWRHVDFKKKLIHVELAMKAKTRTIGKPKSKAGVRDVPIPDIFLPDLVAAKGTPFSPVIAKPISKKRHDETSMADMWHGFKRELDIAMGAPVKQNKILVSVVADDLTPYCLRHTYCTDLQNKEVPINIARYLMGHADIATTSKIYTHTTEKAIELAAKKINAPAVQAVAQNEETS